MKKKSYSKKSAKKHTASKTKKTAKDISIRLQY